MPRVFIVLYLLLQAASAARITVRVEPRWGGGRPLVMDLEKTSDDNEFSETPRKSKAG